MTAKLTELKFETDVKKTIDDALQRSELMQGVIIIGLLKDGSQYLATSTMSGMEKSYLVSFANAYLNDYFNFKETFQQE